MYPSTARIGVSLAAIFVQVTVVSLFFLFVAGSAYAESGLNAITKEIIFNELLSARTLIQVLAGSAVVTALINAIWFVVSGVLLRLQHWWNAKNTVYVVALSRTLSREKYDKVKDLIIDFNCLLVRYGTDQYISVIASDQEKYEGRLKNKVIPIDINFDSAGNPALTLPLPVHHRIGTQFKCFVSVKNEDSIPAVEAFLKDCDRINGIGISKGVKSNRIYFLLERFGVVKTVEGLENNMIYPE